MERSSSLLLALGTLLLMSGNIPFILAGGVMLSQVILTVSDLDKFFDLMLSKRLSKQQIADLFGTVVNNINNYQVEIKPKYSNVKSISLIDTKQNSLSIDFEGVRSMRISKLIEVFGEPFIAPLSLHGRGRNVVFSRKLISSECRIVVNIPNGQKIRNYEVENMTLQCSYL